MRDLWLSMVLVIGFLGFSMLHPLYRVSSAKLWKSSISVEKTSTSRAFDKHPSSISQHGHRSTDRWGGSRDRTDLGSGRSFGTINRPKLRQNRLRPNFQDPVDSAESVKARASALNRSFGQFYRSSGHFTILIGQFYQINQF